jgi:hypothetical protein
MAKEFNLDNYKYVEQHISYEDFLKHGPLKNHLNEVSPYGGTLYGTTGEDLKHILQLPVHNVWTLFEEDGVLKLRNGQQVRGRLGFFHCENMHNAHATIFVDDVPDFRI